MHDGACLALHDGVYDVSVERYAREQPWCSTLALGRAVRDPSHVPEVRGAVALRADHYLPSVHGHLRQKLEADFDAAGSAGDGAGIGYRFLTS
jgi:hypothetical protein